MVGVEIGGANDAAHDHGLAFGIDLNVFRAFDDQISVGKHVRDARGQRGGEVGLARGRAFAIELRVVVRLARLAQGPVARVKPASAGMVLFAAEAREVLVTPVTPAETCSATSTVTMSSTWRARTSLPRSSRREAGVQMEPGVETGPALAGALRMASWM